MTWSFYFLFLSSLFSSRLTRKCGSPFSSSDCHSTHFPWFPTNKKQNLYLQGPGRATETAERRDSGRCLRGGRGALRQTTGGIGEGVRSGRRSSVVGLGRPSRNDCSNSFQLALMAGHLNARSLQHGHVICSPTNVFQTP